MTHFELHLHGDGCWPDAGDADEGQLVGMALLKGGTVGGKHSVTFRIRMPDGGTVLVQTTFALLTQALTAMVQKVELDARAN